MLADTEETIRPPELAAGSKSAMSRVASSVALVPTVGESGRPRGLAASTCLSVSMNPASALMCVNRSAGVSPVI
ncbi:flavin reductase family protein [Caballeronia sp. LjRoot34]|uniref:flavin reductase family protein n=1 Tax=Caballeronia sp. LjRoot34 TaxID=3342325 RepID=UPI003ED094BE